MCNTPNKVFDLVKKNKTKKLRDVQPVFLLYPPYTDAFLHLNRVIRHGIMKHGELLKYGIIKIQTEERHKVHITVDFK